VADTARVVLAGLLRLLGPDRRPVLPAALADRHAWILAG
jgi:hypothetical protein